ncbi:MAG: ketoacyl-ACP synthase III [Lachnospiraceae bacterium]|nr:ketoacyl-ACP synthase III [Lachnospiraceae bacterium]MCI8826305.1 ketoacyl-ACP synthase III [Lachnospiraceae bacterium]
MKILGTGSYLPERIVTNNELSEIVDTNDEWISTRTGIRTRRISAGEAVSDLASKAALAALEDAGISAEQVDMILLATMTGNALMPNTACLVQKNIGAEHAACLDVNAACSGFLYALNLANACLVSGMYKNILVIGAETLSKIIDWADRSTCVLFGDGAGAAVVTADSTKRYVSETGADGGRGDALKAGETGLGNFIVRREEKLNYYMTMNGQEVFKFAVKKVPECISNVLEKAEVSLEEIDYFLLHQANVRIIASVAKRLGVDMEKMPVNLDRYGNTSAASIAILLDEIRKEGKITEGNKIVLAGFGGGLTWGAAYLEL